MFHVSLVGRRNLSAEIYRQIRTAISRGVLRPGQALPPSRQLARTLSVSRMTVTIAYERLLAEGLTTSRAGAGTFVSTKASRVNRGGDRETAGALVPRHVWGSIDLPKPFHDPPAFNFRTGTPDASLFPHHLWRRYLNRAWREKPTALETYGDHAGDPGLRSAIARHIAISRGVHATPDDVIVTSGTQQALDLLVRVLLEPGDRIAMEDPGYPPARRLFQSAGLQLCGLPVDEAGLVVESIPRQVRAVYVTPSHQYPLGVAMTLPRRHALLAWAERHGAAIVEDDYDSEFRFGGRPLEPLQTLDPAGRIIYVGSFSKTLLPGLRIGFVIAPRSLRTAIEKAKSVADWHSPVLEQLALAQFLDDGAFATQVRKACRVYRDRHDLIAAILRRDFVQHLEMLPSSTGIHVTALARHATVDEIAAVARRARAADVAIQELAFFAVTRPPRPGIVLGYGGISTSRIGEGMRRLQQAFRRPR